MFEVGKRDRLTCRRALATLRTVFGLFPRESCWSLPRHGGPASVPAAIAHVCRPGHTRPREISVFHANSFLCGPGHTRPREISVFHAKIRSAAALSLLWLALCWLGGCGGSSPLALAEQDTDDSPPNIIVIFTDDQGYADLGVQGIVEDIRTPNIDQLAADGVRMTAGYVTAPQCTPSRAGLITGRYQQRLGVDRNALRPLPLDELLLSERLQEAGYVTGMVGKWHLAPNHNMTEWLEDNFPELLEIPEDDRELANIPDEKMLPYYASERGFNDTFMGMTAFYWANYNLAGEDITPQDIVQRGYRLDTQTEAALQFVKRNHDQPFFLYLAYFAPHVPLEAPDSYLSRFPGEMAERRRMCLAMMSAIDDGVGRLREILAQYDIDENTLMFFLSDNGAPTILFKEDHDLSFQGPAWDGSLNDPLLGEKAMLSEGGIRVPFIVSWPARIPKGIVYDKAVSSLDVAATAVAAAGLDQPVELDGVDLLPYLSGEDDGDPHEYLFWRFFGQTAVRSGNWKYLQAGDREFLFQLGTDGLERENLIDQYPGQAALMKTRLTEWASELHEPGVPEKTILHQYYDFYFPKNAGAE